MQQSCPKINLFGPCENACMVSMATHVILNICMKTLHCLTFPDSPRWPTPALTRDHLIKKGANSPMVPSRLNTDWGAKRMNYI